MSDKMPMQPVTETAYQEHISKDGAPSPNEVRRRAARTYGPRLDYEPESTTVWSFPDRGDWATHTGNYRGNWSPYIPRNLILKYTAERETVLDQMVGSGTTLVESKLLNRRGIGVDINPHAAMLTYANLNFGVPSDHCRADVYIGDARNLDDIERNTVDLIATHPPYADIIPYSKREIDGDLSALSIPGYVEEMHSVAREAFRVLKPDKYCGILIGDTRKHRHYIPISSLVMYAFLEAGFVLKEDIIKLQWNMKGTRERWRGKSYDFYKIAHEHLFVFRKPGDEEKLTPLKFSSKELLPMAHRALEEGTK